MYVFKDELDEFEEKVAKIVWNFLSKRADPDPPSQKSPDPQNLVTDPLLNWMSSL
jgi:hypothetical protein